MEPHYSDTPEGSYFAIITEEVLYSTELTDSQKLLYACITNLSRTKGYCWASNRHFAEKFNKKVRSIQRDISALRDLGFISSVTQLDEKMAVKCRFLSVLIPRIPPTKNKGCHGDIVVGGGDKFVMGSHDINVTHNNTSINETIFNETIKKRKKKKEKGDSFSGSSKEHIPTTRSDSDTDLSVSEPSLQNHNPITFSNQEKKMENHQNKEVQPKEETREEKLWPGTLPPNTTYIGADGFLMLNGKRWVVCQEDFLGYDDFLKSDLQTNHPDQYALLMENKGPKREEFPENRPKGRK